MTEHKKGPVPDFNRPERILIGTVLKKHLAERGITHYSVSKTLGTSRQYIHGVLNGDFSCTRARYLRICEAAGVDFDEVLAEVAEMKGAGK